MRELQLVAPASNPGLSDITQGKQGVSKISFPEFFIQPVPHSLTWYFSLPLNLVRTQPWHSPGWKRLPPDCKYSFSEEGTKIAFSQTLAAQDSQVPLGGAGLGCLCWEQLVKTLEMSCGKASCSECLCGKGNCALAEMKPEQTQERGGPGSPLLKHLLGNTISQKDGLCCQGRQAPGQTNDHYC